MSKSLSHEDHHISLMEIREAVTLAKTALETIKQINEKYADIVHRFAVIKTNYMGLVKNGNLELYDGSLRLINAEGQLLEEFEPGKYLNYIGEHVED